jgi:hypothetical protein
MPFARAFQTDILALLLRGEAISAFAINATSGPVTDLYLSLHTADPTDTGDQNDFECTCTGYARVQIGRSAIVTPRFEVADGVASPSDPIDFPLISAGTATITHVGIGAFSSGAGRALLFGELTAPFDIEPGDIPRLTPESTFTLR